VTRSLDYVELAVAHIQGSNAMTRRDVAEAGRRFRGFGRPGLAIATAT
jgi:hypothetical protein